MNSKLTATLLVLFVMAHAVWRTESIIPLTSIMIVPLTYLAVAFAESSIPRLNLSFWLDIIVVLGESTLFWLLLDNLTFVTWANMVGSFTAIALLCRKKIERIKKNAAPTFVG